MPFCTYTATADVIGNGVCYDVGKAAFSKDRGFKGYYNKLFPGSGDATYGVFHAAVASGQYVEPTCFGNPATFKGNTDGVPGGDNKRLSHRRHGRARAGNYRGQRAGGRGLNRPKE